ncbi:biliverdin-producing heme oxygenase [Hymenobacter terricola]|uniref:biliverdin-producing heme oxygenase n=1 Tax=Hymenobacter terricola TaxID=2819236 RepID=UPI001B302FED|nr:biliverdin-producing heme oxygenase [Hymenobacter terricola]
MLLTLESPTLMQRLRADTRPYHDAVEQNPFNQALGAGTVTTALTARFLSRMYGFVQPYETQLREQAGQFGPAWQLDQRYRAHLILEDLDQLGYLAAPPLCPALPPLHTRPQLLGAMYVLEGSALGGQVIARQLATAGIAGRTYFAGRAERTGPMWKSFCQQLEATATDHTQAAIAASAIHSFQTLTAWLNQ